jgi:hypothetical protein
MPEGTPVMVRFSEEDLADLDGARGPASRQDFIRHAVHSMVVFLRTPTAFVVEGRTSPDEVTVGETPADAVLEGPPPPLEAESDWGAG